MVHTVEAVRIVTLYGRVDMPLDSSRSATPELPRAEARLQDLPQASFAVDKTYNSP